MSNNTDEQDEATQALLALQGKVAPRSMSAEFIKKHFDPVSAHSQTPGPYARGNEGLTPNIDWKARAEAAEAALAACRNKTLNEVETSFLLKAAHYARQPYDELKREEECLRAVEHVRALKTKEPTNG